jgi:hypothetical protein
MKLFKRKQSARYTLSLGTCLVWLAAWRLTRSKGGHF